MADLNEFIDYLFEKLGNMYVLGGQGGKFVDVLPKICAREENKIGLVNNILTLLHKAFIPCIKYLPKLNPKRFAQILQRVDTRRVLLRVFRSPNTLDCVNGHPA